MQIVVYGTGKVGNGLASLLSKLNYKFSMMVDEDFNDETLIKADKIIVSPGVPPINKLYQKYGDKCVGELEFLGSIRDSLGFQEKPVIVGITGTKGKSTTSWITYNLLEKALGDKYKVLIGGNFDKPLSLLITEILENNRLDKKIIFVLEVSSFMLFNMADFYFDFGIITNISPDHLNRHKDFQEYYDAKLHLLNQTTKKIFMDHNISIENSEKIKKIETNIDININDTQFLGVHNLQNITQSLYLCQELSNELGYKFDIKEWQKWIYEIKPLKHRLQKIAIIEGVTIIDDNGCTNSLSQKSALDAMEKPVLLIAGGSDKGDSYGYLSSLYTEKVKFGIFIGQMATTFGAIFSQHNIPFAYAESLEEAVNKAFQVAQRDGINTILFSPGCASFGMFKDYFERGDRFIQAIQTLQSDLSLD